MPVTLKIHSANSDFQYIETLRRNRVKRHRSGVFFVEGVRPVTLAAEFGWRFDALVYSRQTRLSDWANQIIATSQANTHYELTAPLMETLSQKENPSELLALVSVPPDDLSRIPRNENPLIVVLDRPVSPGNIGTIIRSCDALGADGLIVSGHAADLYDPKVIQASTGSFFCIPSVRVTSHTALQPWIESLRAQYPALQVVGTSVQSDLPIDTHPFTTPTIVLIGNETHGLSHNYQALCDAMVTIPMFGTATSLNMANAASILLYEISRQRKK